MRGLAEVLLRDLQLGHDRRGRDGTEEGMEGLARLEVQRPVLDLHEHVVAEAAVEGHELLVGALDAVGVDLGVVHEGPVHHDPAVRPHRLGEGVRAVRVRPVVVLGAGLPLAVRLHEEAAEVGDPRVDLVRLVAPPLCDGGIEGIRGGQVPQQLGGGEVRGQVRADAIGAERVREGGRLLDIGRAQRFRIRVDAVDHAPVDADRGVRTGVVLDARVHAAGQLVPLPERRPGISALDRAVEVVPVIQDAALDVRPFAHVEGLDRVLRLQEAQEMERAVEGADLAARGHHGRGVRADASRSNDVAFVAEHGEVLFPSEARHERRARRRSNHDSAVLHTLRERHERPQHPAQATLQLGLDESGGSRAARYDDRLQ